MALTPKQRAFCKEYLVDLNATQAAIRAGYSKRTARAIGYENLTKPGIQGEVQRHLAKREQRTEVTADRVLKELARMAFVDTADVVKVGKRGGVTITPTAELSEDQRRAIAEVSQTAYGVRIKLHDKKGALELLGRHLALFVDRIEESGPHGGPIQVEDATELSDEDLERIAGGGKS